ncbi:hypothetical protein [Lentzea sp. NPDC003310]|uniref:hypothetical protein n=1 Tax=Lentzea sp. NPDC003310 TaxID=3154447 RepID=UPI0033BA3E25
MNGQGDPHSRRTFPPGVAVLGGFVLLVGNPWLNLEIAGAATGSSPAFRWVTVLVSYPAWHVDVDRAGPFLFWYANLRVVLFVLLTVAGLARMRRWAGEADVGAARLVTTVGLTTLGAVAAALLSGLVAVSLLDEQGARPYIIAGEAEEFFLTQFGTAAVFGVLFGSVLGAVVAAQRRKPAHRERPAQAPKSLW